MVLEIIPAGSNAVVTEDKNNKDRDVNVNTIVAEGGYRDRCSPSEHVLGAIADLNNAEGIRYGCVVGAVKDAEADMLRTIKDAEADLERSGGQHYGNTMCAIKDAQADLERSTGLHYADIVKTVKDSESQLDRASGDRFIQTVQDIKDAETRLDRSSADKFIRTIEDIRDSQLTTEKSKAKIIEEIKNAELENLKTETRTRELIECGFKEILVNNCENFDDLGEKVQDARREVQKLVFEGFRDNALAFKDQATLALKLYGDSEKTACNNQMQTLLQFKDQALLSERLAAQASKELAVCCCELKERINAEKNETKELIIRIETDRLRERAARSEAQMSAYFARGMAPVVP